jgi:YfiH family protein
MTNKIEIEKPNIFPDNIIAGLTLKNLENFPPNGFSINKALNYTLQEIEYFRQLLANELDIDYQNMIFLHQTHSDKVEIIHNNAKNNIDADGVITNKIKLGLVLSLADCCGILMYDKNNKIISAVHSGWRGTKHKITSKAISILQNQYDSNPNDILVYISPCAGENDYEIGADVAQYFPNHIRQIERSKYLFDLGGAVFDELLSNGIPTKNIEFNRISTISNNNYHSYRREKEKSGRMGLFILMK